MPDWTNLILNNLAAADSKAVPAPAEEMEILRGMLPDLQDHAPDCSATYHKFVTDKHGRPALLFGELVEELLVIHVHWATHCWFNLKATIDGSAGVINDIENAAMEANRGLGTELLRFAEEIFRDRGVSEITGWLSPVDEDHRDRQIHFYRKNGYQVTLRETHGAIRKVLCDLT